jgi:hypothetical protein
MPSIQAIADALSTTFTDERYPVGTLYVQTDNQVKNGVSNVDTTLDFALLSGERTWVFIHAKEAITAGQMVEVDVGVGAVPFSGEPCDGDVVDRYLLLGVADNDIAASSYGWVIKRGACVVLASAGVALGEALDTDGSSGSEGALDTSAGAAGSVGRALEALSGTKTNYVQAYINIP